jgi:hypothetical protein
MTDAMTKGELAALRDELELAPLREQFPGLQVRKLSGGRFHMRRQVGGSTYFAAGSLHSVRNQATYLERRRQRSKSRLG